MKHSDTFERINELDRIELAELVMAVRAHGGEYEFNDDDDPLIVAGQLRCSDLTENLRVIRASINGGIIRIYTKAGEIKCLEAGHASAITAMIPATPEVSEVHAPQEEVWVVLGKTMARLAHREIWSDIKEFIDRNESLDWSWVHETFLTSAEKRAYLSGLFATAYDDEVEVLDPNIEAHRLLIEYCKSKENE